MLSGEKDGVWPHRPHPAVISVLVIDDDQAQRVLFADFCATLGFSWRVAGTLAEGLQAVRAQSADVVVLDFRLPEGESSMALEELGGRPFDAAIIMVSGRADAVSAARTIRTCVIDSLVKPVDLMAFDIAVTRAAELVQLRREVAMLRTHQSRAELPSPDGGVRSVTARRQTLAEAERRAIVGALRSTGGNKVRAAQLLGIARSTLIAKLKLFGIV